MKKQDDIMPPKGTQSSLATDSKEKEIDKLPKKEFKLVI